MVLTVTTFSPVAYAFVLPAPTTPIPDLSFLNLFPGNPGPVDSVFFFFLDETRKLRREVAGVGGMPFPQLGLGSAKEFSPGAESYVIESSGIFQ